MIQLALFVRWLWFVVDFLLGNELLERIDPFALQPHSLPFYHSGSVQRLFVEIDRRFVPLEHSPIDSTTVLLLCYAPKVPEEGLSYPQTATVG